MAEAYNNTVTTPCYRYARLLCISITLTLAVEHQKLPASPQVLFWSGLMIKLGHYIYCPK